MSPNLSGWEPLVRETMQPSHVYITLGTLCVARFVRVLLICPALLAHTWRLLLLMFCRSRAWGRPRDGNVNGRGRLGLK
jgi:hypothetical protein